MTTTTKAETTTPTADVGAYLNNLAWRQKITHTAMGAALGIQQSTMSRKLRGTTPITVDELFILAGLLGADPADILLRACRDSNPKPSDLCLAACPGCGTEGGCTCHLGVKANLTRDRFGLVA